MRNHLFRDSLLTAASLIATQVALAGNEATPELKDKTGLESKQQVSAQNPQDNSQPEPKSSEKEIKADFPALTEILVQASPYDSQVQAVPKAYIRTETRSDLAEALSIIPSVRVANDADSSLQQGDLAPAEFSIRGAAPYQNNFQLDGASVDNLIDPAQTVRADNYTSVAGHAQGQFINSNFLQSVEVSDTNISARDGGFTGGVVKAQTRAYAGKTTAHISYRGTSDSLSNFHIDDDQKKAFDTAAQQIPTGVPGEFQPNFRKGEIIADGATRIGNIGIFAGYSEKHSTITQKQIIELDPANFVNTGLIFKPSESRSLDSHSRYGVVRLDLLDHDYDLNASLSYTGFDRDSFLVNYRNSDFESGHTGYSLSVNYGTSLGETRMDANINAGFIADDHDYDSHTLSNFKDTSLFDGAIVGGLGDLANEQRTLGGSLTFTTPVDEYWLLDYGAEFNYLDFKQQRDRDFTTNDYKLDKNQNPPPEPISPGSFAPSDQFLTRQVVYRAGNIAVSNLGSALFVDLSADYARVFGSFGLRSSRDGVLNNINTAHRLKAGVYLDNSRNMRLIAGVNRYYGKSFLAYRLRAVERKFRVERRRDSPDEPLRLVDNSNEFELRNLDTPYDDEYSLGLAGTVLRGDAGLTYVRRDGKDQIRSNFKTAGGPRFFENSGRSQTDQVDLYWRSLPFVWLTAVWGVNFSASYSDTQTDARYGDDAQGYNGIFDDTEVLFEGRRIPRTELPARDFATPVTAQIDVITSAFRDRVSMRNAFTYTDGYEYLLNQGSDPDTGLTRYKVETQDNTLRWDISTRFTLLSGKHSPYINVDVINVTDSSNIASVEQGTQLFTIGRQYWFEVGYEF